MDKLLEAVRRTAGCEAKHSGSVPVRELFNGQVVWDGVVEVFDLSGHAKAKRAYGWIQPKAEGEPEDKFVTVLEIPPVVDAQTAVRAAIVSQAKS